MVYESDELARQEAAAHPVTDDQAGQLRLQCASKAAELGDDGVRSHTVRFSATAWDRPPGLPDSVPRTGRISRGDVLDIGDQVRTGALHAADLLAAIFVWGWGQAGYGPRRYRDICVAAGNKLESSLQRVLAEIYKDPDSPDPIAGYAYLYGGYDFETQAAPGQGPWGRLAGFGPAFFTKFLYFSTPGAMILDNRLANAVYDRSKLPYLVTEDGRSRSWTPYRYAVYLHWMTQTAHAIGAQPEVLELTLFRPPGELSDEDAAAT